MNKKLILILALAGFTVYSGKAQVTFTIQEVIERAQQQSPSGKVNETQKQTSYWQYRSFRAGFNPQLILSGNAPTYSQRFAGITQPDGSISYVPINQTNPNINLGLFQPIRFTGGSISANTNLFYFNDVTSKTSQWNGTVFNVQLSQPIFAFNPYKWNQKIQPLVFEESKRSFIEQQESISSEAATRFFDVLKSQINIQIAKFNLANNDTIYKIEQGRYNIGTTSKDKLLQVELQLLRSRKDVAQANLDFQTNSLYLRTFIGLKDGEEFNLVMPDATPQFNVTIEDALRFAKLNRKDYIAFERRRMEADRDVAQAKGRRYGSTLNASFGLNNSSPTASDLYINPQRQQVVNVSFNVPIFNWGRNHADMQTAYANKKLNDYLIDQSEITFEQEIITRVRQFELLWLSIEITKKSDEVAQERYNVAQNRYLIGKIDITNLNIALTEKDDAKRAYIEALKSFWAAYYDLRRLTLYDFADKRLLYINNE
jgi:outer membrane protein TolC